MTGRIVSGVEPGCRLLRDGTREYLLLPERGDARADRVLPPAGSRVTVTGRVRPDLATTCLQGVPLVVVSIRRV